MRRLTLFAKGNLDLRDSLHAMRSGGAVLWNGINEIVRERFPETRVRVQHELWTRSDALLEARSSVPAELAERSLPLEPYSLATQFSTALFETDADAIVLSIQPDLNVSLVRHRRDGYLFYPNDWRSWPAADQQWLRDSFMGVGLLDVQQSMENFARIVARLRERTEVPILIYNVSSVIPGERIHCHDGLEEALSTRIRRFNLGLSELSQQTGVSIIDVDMILARAGAERLKHDAVHLTAEGCRLVAEEVVRVLEDWGCFAASETSRCE